MAFVLGATASWSGFPSAHAQAVNEKGNLPFLGVVGFRTAETPTETFVRAEIADEFNRSGRVRMIPERLTRQVVDDIWSENKSTSKQLVKEASANFSEGKRFYSQLMMEDAINSFNKAVVGYREGIGSLRDNRYLLISHLYLGMALMVLGRKQEGENFIREMVVLDANRSQRRLSPTEFPPEVLSIHRKVTKQVLSAPMGNVSISFKPENAKIYVDAVLQDPKGKASIDLPVGEHFVVVEKKGFRQFSKRILVKPGSNPIEVDLEEWQLLSTYSFERRNNLLATEDLFKLAGDLSANMLLLGSIVPIQPGRSSVTAQLFDVRTREFSKVEKLEVADSDLQSSGRKLAKKLILNLTRSGAIVVEQKEVVPSKEPALNPSKVSSPTVVVPAKRKSRPSSDENPFYRQWWFWTAVGVVVAAGAGASILLLTKKDPEYNVLVIDNPL